MQEPPDKLPGEAQNIRLSPIQAEARSSLDDRFLSTPEITISRYASF